MERTREVNGRAISLAFRRLDKAQTDRCEVAACRLCPVEDVIEVREPGFVKVVVATTKGCAECKTFLIYALFAVLGVAMLTRILPETRGRSLEELEESLVRQQ